MFTGIIEGLGTIKGLTPSASGRRLAVDADFSLAASRVGDSICVDGACLTAIRIDDLRFEADLSPETLAKTTLGRAQIGSRVNLERALRLSDRIDGHLVSGHIDATGRITETADTGRTRVISIAVSSAIARYIIAKGSVAVDGISLTVNRCEQDGFSISIIPHTASLTTLGFKRVGDVVNIETDMIGKYVERLVSVPLKHQDRRQASAVDMDLLARTGFLKP